jgi:CheY-like chemotaxis protein
MLGNLSEDVWMEDRMIDMSNITLLYVDDDELIRDMIEHVLLAHYPAIKLIFAVDGLDALEKIAEYNPDILVVDYYMPNLDRYELSKRALSDNGSIDIIVVSGCLSAPARELFAGLGISKLLTKPINYQVLYDTIDELAGAIFLEKH